MKNISDLFNKVSLVCPIEGLSGDIGDLPNIRIDYSNSATEDQIKAATQCVLDFIVDIPDPDPALFLSTLAGDINVNSGTYIIATLIAAAPQRYSALTKNLPQNTQTILQNAASLANMETS